MFKHYFEYGHHHHGRWFEKGDLKYVILDLIKDKPAHGYEIIHALEDRCHGFYAPSAGSVYPTLQLLEDLDYVSVSEQDGKKIYTITEKGKKFLQEHEETISKIKEQMHGWWGFEHRGELKEIFTEFREIGRLVITNSRQLSSDDWQKIKEVLARTRQDLEGILKAEK
jgi:DNA-binding PadR family transcriptional regulator